MFKFKKILHSLIVCFVSFGIHSRAGSVFLFLKDIPGESRDKVHNDWIDLNSFSHEINFGPWPLRAAHHSIRVEKFLDASSPLLEFHCNKRTVIPDAIIEFTRLEEKEIRFYRIELTNVMIARVETASGPGEDPVLETVDLNYEQIQWDYTPFNSDGTPSPDVISWWNVPLNIGGMTLPNPDNDNDGIPDNSDPDDDNDGMTDVYENANGLNPFVSDSGGDLDHDGASNYNEFLAGTAANDPNSIFRVTRTRIVSGGAQITWASVAGKTYEVYSSSDLAGPFVFVSSVPSAGDGETSAVVSNGGGQKFFRIRVLP